MPYLSCIVRGVPELVGDVAGEVLLERRLAGLRLAAQRADELGLALRLVQQHADDALLVELPQEGRLVERQPPTVPQQRPHDALGPARLVRPETAEVSYRRPLGQPVIVRHSVLSVVAAPDLPAVLAGEERGGQRPQRRPCALGPPGCARLHRPQLLGEHTERLWEHTRGRHCIGEERDGGGRTRRGKWSQCLYHRQLGHDADSFALVDQRRDHVGEGLGLAAARGAAEHEALAADRNQAI